MWLVELPIVYTIRVSNRWLVFSVNTCHIVLRLQQLFHFITSSWLVSLFQAYQRPRATAVQIARIAAGTVIAVSFIIGCFMLASAYITATASCAGYEALRQVGCLQCNKRMYQYLCTSEVGWVIITYVQGKANGSFLVVSKGGWMGHY